MSDLDECRHGLGPVTACTTALTELERLIAIETDECVLWTGYRSGKYGRVRVGRRMELVHVLALIRRVGPRPEGSEAAHRPIVCHAPLCVNYRHLRWATRRENKADMLLDGTRPSGETHGRARLTAADVRIIRSLAEQRVSHGQIARQFRVGRTTVTHVVNRDTWRDVA